MAKSKTFSQRDITNPSLATLLTYKIRPSVPLTPYPIERYEVLEEGDRRRFNPTRSISPPHSVRRYAARVTATKYGSLNSLRFADPRLVALCVRRKIRREVVFALRKNKAGSGSKKRKNFWSHISC